ncbi:MAG: L,D-transpeptidase family protein [Anaerolineaceae bacterium]|nr:L,D-transpeptidase family protein [Anaerolineaceae bacterium]
MNKVNKPMYSSRPVNSPRPQPNPKNTPPKPKRNWLPWLVVGAIGAIGAAVFTFIGILLLVGLLSNRGIASGVSIAGLAVGGDSIETARIQLTNWAQRPVKLTDGDRSWQLSLADLGVQLDIEGTLDALKNAPAQTKLQRRLTVDLVKTQDRLFDLSNEVNVAAVPGNPPQQGRAMDIPVTLSRLQADASGELSDGVLELDMMVVDPPETESRGINSGARTTHIVEKGQELALIARDYGVDMQDILALNNISNPDLLYVGQELIIPASGEYEPTQADAPAAPTNSGRSIVVSTGEQRIYAYEDGTLVHSHLASTGLPATPTVLGDYKIYVKYLADDMSGPGYFLPQVPYTMYFYQGYGIHGTYWHNSFGRPMSHGCVNLPTPEAQWFFDWASVGTPVRVI